MAVPRGEEFEREAMPHLNALYRAASRAVGSTADAADIVQETYVQAWRSFDRFEPGTNCRAWLFKILLYAIHHHRRRASRFKLVHPREDALGLEETLVWSPPVSETLEDEEIVRAIEALAPCYREVVLLVDMQEFTYREAAEALGVPIGTVMSRLSRGRGMMRRRLGEHAKSYGINVAVA